jgi:carboxymethylenebutenolidase
MTVTKRTIPVEAGELPLTVASAEGRGAAIVIVPSVFGVAPDLEQQMEELASDARLVIAIDPFFREGGGHLPYDDLAPAIARLGSFDRKRSYRDLRAAIDWARAQDGVDRVVALGICFGGSYVLLAAADGLVDGIVTWHGSRMESFVHRAPEVKCPAHLHFGGIDPIVPPAALDALRAAFNGQGHVQMIVHEGVNHGFSHRTGRAFDAAAERAGMDSLRELSR